MNHFIRVFLAVALCGAAVLTILSLTGHFGPRTHMDAFVAETIRSALGQDAVIEEYVEASLPRRLQRDMLKVWSHGPLFYSMTLPSTLGQPSSATSTVISYPVQTYAGYSRPLPYPPEELWCVRLKSTDPTVPRVLLLAFHKDIYTASWVVHEPSDVAAVLSIVGCHFSNQ